MNDANSQGGSTRAESVAQRPHPAPQRFLFRVWGVLRRWVWAFPSDEALTSGQPIKMRVLGVVYAAVLAYGLFATPFLTSFPYVLVNLAVAGVLLVLARFLPLTWYQLGLGTRGLKKGVITGCAMAAAAGLLIEGAGLFVWPDEVRRFADVELGDYSVPRLLLELGRILVGTALVEEFIFRGFLLAAVARGRSAGLGNLWSSLLFGLWHIGPNLEDIGGFGALLSTNAWSLAPHVLFTFAAGMTLLGPLRVRTRGLAAGIIIHAAVNAFLTLVAFALIG